MDNHTEPRSAATHICSCGKLCGDHSANPEETKGAEQVESTLNTLIATLESKALMGHEELAQEFRRTREEARRQDDRLRGILRSMRREIKVASAQNSPDAVGQQVLAVLRGRFKMLSQATQGVAREVTALRERADHEQQEQVVREQNAQLQKRFQEEFAIEIAQGSAKASA